MLRLLMVSILVLLLEPAFAQELSAANDAPGQTLDDGRRSLKQFPMNVLRGVTGMFARDNLRPLLIGSLATGISSVADDEVRDWIADEDDELSDFADDNLGPTGVGAVALALFIGGRFSEDARFRAMTYDLGVASINTYGFTQVLKATVNRERPNKRNDSAFPSGHTSSAFTLAAVASAHYGGKVGIAAYAAASAIGASRLRNNEHWLSDVVGGAALGILAGRTVVRQNDQPRQGAVPRKVVRVMPSLGPSVQAIVVDVTF